MQQEQLAYMGVNGFPDITTRLEVAVSVKLLHSNGIAFLSLVLDDVLTIEFKKIPKARQPSILEFAMLLSAVSLLSLTSIQLVQIPILAKRA